MRMLVDMCRVVFCANILPCLSSRKIAPYPRAERAANSSYQARQSSAMSGQSHSLHTYSEVRHILHVLTYTVLLTNISFIAVIRIS